MVQSCWLGFCQSCEELNFSCIVCSFHPPFLEVGRFQCSDLQWQDLKFNSLCRGFKIPYFYFHMGRGNASSSQFVKEESSYYERELCSDNGILERGTAN